MKSRRTWVPNTHPKTYFSNVLGRNCSFSVSAKAIRCIDKAGGFDSYILRTRDEYLGYEGSSGVALKHEMLAALHLPKTSSKDEITARIRARMGLPVVPIDFEALRKSVAEGVAKETVASA
jgi:large subunit ribosomal protein L28